MSIREEDQPSDQTTGARNAGGDIQVKGGLSRDGGDGSNESEATADRDSADRLSQQSS